MLPSLKLSIIDRFGQSPILRKVLQRAMRKGEVVEMEAGEGSNFRRSTLLLHGAKIATAVVVELVEPPAAFRLLGG